MLLQFTFEPFTEHLKLIVLEIGAVNENNIMATWQVILTEFQKRNYFQNGMTLPFLIGSYYYYSSDYAVPTLRQLLTEMSDNEVGVTMLFCNGIDEYVFAMLDSETSDYVKKSNNSFNHYNNLIDLDGLFTHSDKLSDVASILETRYKKNLDENLFSKIMGSWQTFSYTDIRNLDSIREFLV